jgi:hypothetical protein
VVYVGEEDSKREAGGKVKKEERSVCKKRDEILKPVLRIRICGIRMF